MEICKNEIDALDGSIGEITNLLIDDTTWRITHLFGNNEDFVSR